MAQRDPFSTIMAMDEATWARHANPWSVWTRVPLLALFAVVVFFRASLGFWLWPALGLLALWALINPRAFPPPASTANWASRGVLGEQLWLRRKSSPIPQHHARWAMGLALGSAACLLPLAWGLYVLDPWATAFGSLGSTALKLWFVDRMVWLHQDMSDRGRASPPLPGRD